MKYEKLFNKFLKGNNNYNIKLNDKIFFKNGIILQANKNKVISNPMLSNAKVFREKVNRI